MGNSSDAIEGRADKETASSLESVIFRITTKNCQNQSSHFRRILLELLEETHQHQKENQGCGSG